MARVNPRRADGSTLSRDVSIAIFIISILVASTLLTLPSAITGAPAAGVAAGGKGGGGGGGSLTASSAWDERNLGKGGDASAARTPAMSSSSVLRGMASDDDDDDDDGEDDDPGCCAVMCTTPANACCLSCRDESSPRERDLLMAMMEGLTHHIMDKHSPDPTASTWAAGDKWLTNRAWEGNSHVGNRPAQATYYYDWARSVFAGVGGGGGAPGHVCEIGMNGGHSALIFLAATSRYGEVDGGGAKLTMFDLSQFDYSVTAMRYIETLYPGRFASHVGDSHVVLPEWTSGLDGNGNGRSSDGRCDVFSIDGDHSHGGALTDIRNAAAATKRGGKVILDDMNPGGKTRRAFDDAVDEKIIGDPKCVEDVLIRVGYDDRSSVANARSLMASWCSATVL